jgi:hypothetical protein
MILPLESINLQKLRVKILRESRNGTCSIMLERLRFAIVRGDLRANSVESTVSDPEKSHVAAILRTEHGRRYMGNILEAFAILNKQKGVTLR